MADLFSHFKNESDDAFKTRVFKKVRNRNASLLKVFKAIFRPFPFSYLKTIYIYHIAIGFSLFSMSSVFGYLVSKNTRWPSVRPWRVAAIAALKSVSTVFVEQLPCPFVITVYIGFVESILRPLKKFRLSIPSPVSFFQKVMTQVMCFYQIEASYA